MAARGQIRAIRISLVVRSRQAERAPPVVGDRGWQHVVCWLPGTTSITLYAYLEASLRYTVQTNTAFRYNVYNSVVPLRNNMIPRYFSR